MHIKVTILFSFFLCMSTIIIHKYNIKCNSFPPHPHLLIIAVNIFRRKISSNIILGYLDLHLQSL